MILEISDYPLLPANFKEALLRYHEDFLRQEHLETILENPEFRGLTEDIDRWIRTNELRVYHCSRADSSDSFLINGLRSLDIFSHRENFLRDFGHRFTRAERAEMVAAWNECNSQGLHNVRQGRLYFCISKKCIKGSGTVDFFSYFGGESIYFHLKNSSTALKKLKKLGRPFVVEAVVPAGDLIEARPSLGMTMLSHYHASINLDACICESDGYLLRNVSPTEVRKVILLEDFVQ